jgi:hypothetical protein
MQEGLNFDYRNMNFEDLEGISDKQLSHFLQKSTTTGVGSNVDFLGHLDEMEMSNSHVKAPEVQKININQVKWKKDPS